MRTLCGAHLFLCRHCTKTRVAGPYVSGKHEPGNGLFLCCIKNCPEQKKICVRKSGRVKRGKPTLQYMPTSCPHNMSLNVCQPLIISPANWWIVKPCMSPKNNRFVVKLRVQQSEIFRKLQKISY